MKAKHILHLILAAAFSLPSFANTPIPLKKEPGPTTGSRTIVENTVTANLDEDNNSLLLEFSEVAEYCIVISSAYHGDSLLIQQSNYPEYATQIDLSSLTTGSYVVEIYAYGRWWIGYFVID